LDDAPEPASETPEGGLIWPSGDGARLPNAGALDKVDAAARRVARHFSEQTRQHYRRRLHSVHLYGPRARGCAGPLRFLIVTRGQNASDAAWSHIAIGALNVRWPGTNRLMTDVIDLADLCAGPELFDYNRFRLATSSVCFAGRDLGSQLPRQTLGTGFINHLVLRAQNEMVRVTSLDIYDASESEIRRLISRRAETLLAACFALSVAREQVFTDLPAEMAALAGLQFPERVRDFKRLASFSVEPPAHASIALPLIDSVSGWFGHQAEGWLARHNPARLAALKV
jgi:hypothetical protein